ncbi:MAG: helix-turn-helix transcriptional regulator [Pseudomonadota bacterium]
MNGVGDNSARWRRVRVGLTAPRAYISGVERSVRNPSILALKRIADALDVDVADLLDSDAAQSYARDRQSA